MTTYIPNTEDGRDMIAQYRHESRELNKMHKSSGSKVRFKVCVYGRLGKNSQFAELYKYHHTTWIKPEHSSYFKVYFRQVK